MSRGAGSPGLRDGAYGSMVPKTNECFIIIEMVKHKILQERVRQALRPSEVGNDVPDSIRDASSESEDESEGLMEHVHKKPRLHKFKKFAQRVSEVGNVPPMARFTCLCILVHLCNSWPYHSIFIT